MTNIIPGRFTVGWKDTNDGAYLAHPDVYLTAEQVVEQLHNYFANGATDDWCEFSIIPTTSSHIDEGQVGAEQ